MRFVLTSFAQNENVRQYRFQGIAPGGKRTDWNVAVDLSLLQKHGIPLQEAPLLCSQLLAAQAGQEQNAGLVISESDMLARAAQRAGERAEAQNKRKPPVPAPPAQLDASLPQPAPAHGYGKPAIGLGSRYPWSPALQNTTKR